MTLNRLIQIIKNFSANTPAKQQQLLRATEAFSALYAAKRAGRDVTSEAVAFISAVKAMRVAELELATDADFLLALCSLNRPA